MGATEREQELLRQARELGVSTAGLYSTNGTMVGRPELERRIREAKREKREEELHRLELERTKRETEEAARQRRWWTRVWKIMLGISAILGIVAAIASLL
jgi:hypothetical protein